MSFKITRFLNLDQFSFDPELIYEQNQNIYFLIRGSCVVLAEFPVLYCGDKLIVL